MGCEMVVLLQFCHSFAIYQQKYLISFNSIYESIGVLASFSNAFFICFCDLKKYYEFKHLLCSTEVRDAENVPILAIVSLFKLVPVPESF